MLAGSRWIGLQINDQATNTNSESSQWIFQRYSRSHPERHKVMIDRKRMILRTVGEISEADRKLN